MTGERGKKPWRVDYNLAYDCGGSGPWSKYYRTKTGATVSMWWNKYVASWGGSAVLTHHHERLAIRADAQNQRWMDDPDSYLKRVRSWGSS